MNIFDACDAKFHLNINLLLKMLTILPNSTTENERLSTTLKRLNETFFSISLLESIYISTDEVLDIITKTNRKIIILYYYVLLYF